VEKRGKRREDKREDENDEGESFVSKAAIGEARDEQDVARQA
jgi:hypothetical protein